MVKWILFILVILLAVPLVSAGKVTYEIHNAGTNSMSPTFNGTSRLFIQVVFPKEELSIGEIYCYRDYDYMRTYIWIRTCHRLVKITQENNYLFKADNYDYYDKVVERNNIEWQIVNII